MSFFSESGATQLIEALLKNNDFNYRIIDKVSAVDTYMNLVDVWNFFGDDDDDLSAKVILEMIELPVDTRNFVEINNGWLVKRVA